MGAGPALWPLVKLDPAETYAVKYFLQKLFLIPTTDNLDPVNFDTVVDSITCPLVAVPETGSLTSRLGFSEFYC